MYTVTRKIPTAIVGVVRQENAIRQQWMIASNNDICSYVFVQFDQLCKQKCCEEDQLKSHQNAG